jgi:hypothetical protein
MRPQISGSRPEGLSGKTNWQSYLAKSRELSPILRKRTGRLNRLNQKSLILKILNPFIRWDNTLTGSFSDSTREVRPAKTNWQSYLPQSKPVGSILAKQTGRLNQQDLILKILNPFIRCDVQAKSAKTKPNKANGLNPFKISAMHEKFRKQSQRCYLPYFVVIAAKKGLFFGKNKWSWMIPSIFADATAGRWGLGLGVSAAASINTGRNLP